MLHSKDKYLTDDNTFRLVISYQSLEVIKEKIDTRAIRNALFAQRHQYRYIKKGRRRKEIDAPPDGLLTNSCDDKVHNRICQNRNH